MNAPPTAIGIVRVSQVSGREGESFASPSDQRDAIHALAEIEGWRVQDIHDELDISGNALLEDRPGLSRAVAAVQTGSADIVVSATTERLWWNAEVRAQVLRLVEGAGGEVWSADEGRLSNGTAAEEFSGTVRTSADRFSRRQNAEKSSTAVKRAIARGVAPWPNVPPGYVRNDEESFVPSDDAPTVLAAFELRDTGATISEVRAFLNARGIVRSYHGVSALLKSRAYLGEIHFGSYEPNLKAHDAIVPRELWQRVQRTSSTRGRKAKSDRLLARLGVLRCATCNARMVVGTSNNSAYWIYRCPPNGDCDRRVTISADIAENTVVDEVRQALADSEGRASAEQGAREAEHALELAQSELDGAIRTLAGFEDETAARDRLAELRETRDGARARVDQLGRTRATVTLNAAADWDRLSLDARRALIRATVERVRVGPGRGASRVAVELVGE